MLVLSVITMTFRLFPSLFEFLLLNGNFNRSGEIPGEILILCDRSITVNKVQLEIRSEILLLWPI